MRFECRQRRSVQGGFTLIELMMVLVIVAILAAIAGPSFRDTIERNRRFFTIEQTLALLAQARGEAVARSARVHVCPSSDGLTCIDSSNVWSPGVIAFVDDGGGDAACGTANDGVWQKASSCEDGVKVIASYPDGVDVYGPAPSGSSESVIVFDADGGASSAVTLEICDRNGVTAASGIVVNVSGQLRLAVDEDDSGVVNGLVGGTAADLTCT